MYTLKKNTLYPASNTRIVTVVHVLTHTGSPHVDSFPRCVCSKLKVFPLRTLVFPLVPSLHFYHWFGMEPAHLNRPSSPEKNAVRER